jgi:hypothetical protein
MDDGRPEDRKKERKGNRGGGDDSHSSALSSFPNSTIPPFPLASGSEQRFEEFLSGHDHSSPPPEELPLPIWRGWEIWGDFRSCLDGVSIFFGEIWVWGGEGAMGVIMIIRMGDRSGWVIPMGG